MRPFRTRCGLTLALAVASSSSGAMGRLHPRFIPSHLPYRARWGAYTVRVEGPGGDQRALIVDRSGTIQREIRDVEFIRLRFRQLNGRGLPDLWITSHSAGSGFDYTDYIFTQDGGIRNLLIYDGGRGGIRDARDLNGAGRPQLIAWKDTLAYAAGLPGAATPWVVQVIGWNGRRYVDQTKSFPAPVRAKALEYRRELTATLRGRDDQYLHSLATGYYANSVAAGEGREAWCWLMRHGRRALRAWLLRYREELAEKALRGRSKIRVSQDRVLVHRNWD